MEDTIILHLIFYNFILIYLINIIKNTSDDIYYIKNNIIYYVCNLVLIVVLTLPYYNYKYKFYEFSDIKQVSLEDTKQILLSFTMVNLFDFVFELLSQTKNHINYIINDKNNLNNESEEENYNKEKIIKKVNFGEENIAYFKKSFEQDKNIKEFNLTEECKKEIKDILKNCEERQIRLLIRTINKHINGQDFWNKKL
jgi:hypothetical protein